VARSIYAFLGQVIDSHCPSIGCDWCIISDLTAWIGVVWEFGAMSSYKAAVYSPPTLGLPYVGVVISEANWIMAAAFSDPVSAQAFVQDTVKRLTKSAILSQTECSSRH